MKTEGKQSKNNFMLMKTWQGEKGEKMRRDLKYKTVQKASAMNAWAWLRKHLCSSSLSAGRAAGLREDKKQ